MHKYENEYNLLLKQREQLIGSIQQANKSFHICGFFCTNSTVHGAYAVVPFE